MQSILEQTVETLHEANERMDEDEQYAILGQSRSTLDLRRTILDGGILHVPHRVNRSNRGTGVRQTTHHVDVGFESR